MCIGISICLYHSLSLRRAPSRDGHQRMRLVSQRQPWRSFSWPEPNVNSWRTWENRFTRVWGWGRTRTRLSLVLAGRKTWVSEWGNSSLTYAHKEREKDRDDVHPDDHAVHFPVTGERIDLDRLRRQWREHPFHFNFSPTHTSLSKQHTTLSLPRPSHTLSSRSPTPQVYLESFAVRLLFHFL